jgi:lipopolysaccharide exporter
MDRRQYLRHFMVLFTGTAAAQLMNLASYPFLARLYTPADFGIFATFVAVSAIPGAIACGRFDLAVPTAPSMGRFAILWLCVIIATGMGVLSAAGGAIYWSVIEGVADPLRPLLLGLCVFFTGFCAASSLYLMRHDWYRVNSASLLARTGAVVLLQIGLAFVWRHPLSLIIGFTVGFGVQALIFAWTVWRHIPPGPPRPRQMRAMFRRYRSQVAVDIPSTFVAALSLNLLTFMLAVLYGQYTVGLYALGSRIAIMPLQLFNDSLSQVFFQKAATAQRERGHFWPEMKFNLLTSGILSIGVLAAIWLFAHPFIRIFLGVEWVPAADILVVLAPMLAVRSLCMSVATTVFVLKRAHWLFVHNIANASTLGIAFLGAQLWDLGVMPFLYLAVALLIVEYAVFALFLALKARAGAVAAATAAR